jgi:cytoskeletal protein CcmA (bactofilin family)
MLNRRRTDRAADHHDTSLIARGTVLRGDLHFSGALHLDGRIEGAVLAEGEDAVFTLSENGQVQGDIRVPHAVINGQVQGDIQASRKLELAPNARIVGDVRYSMLEMAAGAQVNGHMTHDAEMAPAQRLLASETETLGDAVPA